MFKNNVAISILHHSFEDSNGRVTKTGAGIALTIAEMGNVSGGAYEGYLAIEFAKQSPKPLSAPKFPASKSGR